MPQFKRKPGVIDAVQFRGDFNSAMDVCHTLMSPDVWPDFEDGRYTGKLCVKTLAGVVRANDGDWIIITVDGEHYPCDAITFEKNYEPVQ